MNQTRRAPAVSAMMPAHNAGKYISEAIHSVLAQTLGSWELIVVDDGSTDDTAEIVGQFKDPRITLVRSDSNVGRGAARNLALDQCMGSFVAICDADDISLPDRFALQVEEFEKEPSIGVVAGQVLYFHDSTTPVMKFVFPEEDDAIRRRFARGHCAVPNAAAMIRRSLFSECGRYDPAFLRAQDHEFFLRALEKTHFRTLPSPLVLYRQGPRVLDIKYWRRTVHFQRYAYHLRRAQGPEMSIGFSAFRDSLNERMYMNTVGLARYAHLRVRDVIGASRRLR